MKLTLGGSFHGEADFPERCIFHPPPGEGGKLPFGSPDGIFSWENDD